MKSLVIAPTLHSSNWRVFAETLAFIIWVDFTGEIWVKSADFMGEILGHSPHPAFIKLKSFCWNTCFYNFGWISQVKSGLNPPDFTGQIHQISGWNLVDFMKSLVIAPTLHSSNWRVFAETLAFIIWVDFTGEIWVKSADFMGEILGHSPHPAFIKLKSFCWNTCFYNLGGFHRWNLGEICRFHGWNPWS